jgi:hypothetical protein
MLVEAFRGAVCWIHAKPTSKGENFVTLTLQQKHGLPGGRYRVIKRKKQVKGCAEKFGVTTLL